MSMFEFSDADLDFLAAKYSRQVRDVAVILSDKIHPTWRSTTSNSLKKSLVVFQLLEEYKQLKLITGLSTAFFIEYCATVPIHNCRLSQFCRTLLSGSTPLHLAVRYRNCSVIETLKLGGFLTMKNQYGDTPLHCACCYGYKLEASVLIDAAFHQNRTSFGQNIYGNTPLHLACFHSGQADVIKEVIEYDNSCMFSKNRAKKFPLQIAVEHHNFEYIDIFLKTYIECCSLYPSKIYRFSVDEYVQICKELFSNSVDFRNILLSQAQSDLMFKFGLLPLEHYIISLKKMGHHCSWYVPFSREITTKKVSEVFKTCLGSAVICHIYTNSFTNYYYAYIIELGKAIQFKSFETIHQNVSRQEIDDLLLVWSNNVEVVHCMCTSQDSRLHLSKYNLVNCAVDTKNDLDRTPFDEAYLIGHVTACVWLMVIKQCSLYLNIYNSDFGRRRAVQHICSNALSRFPEDCEIDSIVPGDTLLHIAASLKNAAELIHYLTVTMMFDVTKVNSKQEYPLHIACRAGHSSKVIKLLLNCDLLHQNVDGDSPIDLMFLHYHCESVLTILDLHSEGFFLNDIVVVSEWMKHIEKYTYYGKNSPLHLAIRVCSESEIEELNEINLESFMKWSSHRNIFGELPIHLAARYRNLKVLTLVCNQENYNAATNLGNTAVHEICCNSSNTDKDLVEIFKFLHCDLHCNIHAANNKGQTALHICCQQLRCSELVEYLLSIAKLDPNAKDITGSTPLMVTPLGHCEVIRLLIQYGADSSCLYQKYKTFFKKNSSETPPPTPLNVIVVGNHSSGKSTLIKALKSEDSNSMVQGEPLTAGIIPSFSQSSRFGNIMWYDLAGQSEYYASHEAVLNTVMTSSPPLVLLLVDIRKPQEVIHQEILYWLHFLLSQIKSKKYPVQPHVSVIFSFKDELHECAQDKIEFSQDVLKSFFKKCIFQFVPFIALDCRWPNSNEIHLVHSQIQKSHLVLCDKTQLDFLLHCFYAFLLGNFKNEPAVTMQKILCLTEDWIATGIDPHYEEDVVEDDDSDESVESFGSEFQFFEEQSPAKLLPNDHQHVFDMCKKLFLKGHIMVIKGCLNTAENSWVVINKDILLKEVNGSLFAPEKFKCYYKDISTSTGVVTLRKLSEILPDYDSDVLSGFLTYLEFCNEITDKDILQLLELKTESCDDRFFFFPGLVSIEKPEWAWKDGQQSFNKFGWILYVAEPNTFFTPRFIHILLLRLAFSYPYSSSNKTTGLPSLTVTQACSVWKNGLFWQTRMGLECLIEVIDNSSAIVLLLRSTGLPLSERSLTSSFQYRSNLISSILSIVEELASFMIVEECVLHPNYVTYPPPKCADAALYRIRTIADAICSRHPYAPSTSTKFDKAELTDILDFEPFRYTDNYRLFNKSIRKLEVTNEELHQFSISLTSTGPVYCAIYYSIFAENKVVISSGETISKEIMYNRLIEWRNKKKATYGDLYSLLAQYSLFGNRDFPELSGCSAVEFISLSSDNPVNVPPSRDLPTLPALIAFKCKNGQKINILEKIGDKYSDFGILLLKDKDGSKLKAINHENRGEIKPILRDIANRWLQGEGRTVLWETIVEVLEDIGLSRLSEEICSTIQYN